MEISITDQIIAFLTLLAVMYKGSTGLFKMITTTELERRHNPQSKNAERLFAIILCLSFGTIFVFVVSNFIILDLIKSDTLNGILGLTGIIFGCIALVINLLLIFVFRKSYVPIPFITSAIVFTYCFSLISYMIYLDYYNQNLSILILIYFIFWFLGSMIIFAYYNRHNKATMKTPLPFYQLTENEYNLIFSKGQYFLNSVEPNRQIITPDPSESQETYPIYVYHTDTDKIFVYGKTKPRDPRNEYDIKHNNLSVVVDNGHKKNRKF